MKTLQLIALSIISVFAPTKPILITSLVLVVVDLMFGILVAKKNKLPITSNGLKRTVLKLLVYEVAILVSFLVGTYLVDSFLPILKMVTSLIGLTELKSILENLDELSGGSFFGNLINKIQNILSNRDNTPPQS